MQKKKKKSCAADLALKQETASSLGSLRAPLWRLRSSRSAVQCRRSLFCFAKRRAQLFPPPQRKHSTSSIASPHLELDPPPPWPRPRTRSTRWRSHCRRPPKPRRRPPLSPSARAAATCPGSTPSSVLSSPACPLGSVRPSVRPPVYIDLLPLFLPPPPLPFIRSFLATVSLCTTPCRRAGRGSWRTRSPTWGCCGPRSRSSRRAPSSGDRWRRRRSGRGARGRGQEGVVLRRPPAGGAAPGRADARAGGVPAARRARPRGHGHQPRRRGRGHGHHGACAAEIPPEDSRRYQEQHCVIG